MVEVRAVVYVGLAKLSVMAKKFHSWRAIRAVFINGSSLGERDQESTLCKTRKSRNVFGSLGMNDGAR